ncbi:hypothetical protein JL721_902 [Aureococcus anophagefferens]|nr:hypothetical protein JL721_902 [Aureococcus anophagefferens]
MSMLWTATVAVLAAAAGAVVVAPPQTTLKAPTQVPSLPRQSYESPALEPILLDRSSSLEEKIGGIKAHYETRPWLVARRLASISAAALRSYGAWARGSPDDFDEFAREARKGLRPGASPRGAVLRDEISKLGVVFVKLAQTMATRPDIIGEEAAASLESLQDGNRPFDDAVALASIEAELAGSPLELVRISEKAVAAASLAQVYRGETAGGAAVAIKVRRPGVVDQVALDTYAVRVMLKALQEFWGTNSTDYPAIVNEVTAGLFRELDFREEASNAARFWDAHRPLAGYLRVPRAGYARGDARGWSVTPRVHVAEWIDGEPLGAISESRQRAMVQKGLDVCFLQLFGTGFVHADPHYGNMMYDRDDNLVLLDFGLVTNLTVPQTEAMATAVTAILNEDWPTLLDSFRDIGLVPPEPAIWVDAKTGEPISGLLPGAWRRCSEDEFAASFVEALEGGGDRAMAGSFTEITARLTELALTYQFILPPWLLFVVRAVITLDGFAAGMDPPLSALAAAAPHAACRVLAPRTAKGEAQLRASLFEPGSAPSASAPRGAAAAAEMPCEDDACSVDTARQRGDDAANVAARVAALLLTDADGRAHRRVARGVGGAARLRRRRARGLRARRGAGAPARRRARGARRAGGAPAASARPRPAAASGVAGAVAAPSPTRAGDARLFEPAARTDLRRRRPGGSAACSASSPRARDLAPAAPRRVPRGPRRGLRGARGARRPRRRRGRGAEDPLAVLAAAAARGAWVRGKD